MQKQNKIDWSGPIQIAIVTSILLGANLPFYFISKADIKAFQKESKEFWEKWAEESKEYHGRLVAIEERIASQKNKQ